MMRLRWAWTLTGLLVVLALAISTRSGWSAPAEVRTLVVGLGSNYRVIAAAAPLASGEWGTDYITVSHALGVGQRYSITLGGKEFTDATPVAACSSQYHGLDVFILRVVSHKNRPVLEWADPAELRAGDQLMALVWPEFHPTPVPITFLHLNLLEWSKSKPDEWPHAWHNVMVGQGASVSGFSGSPWERNGKIYGLHKGRVRQTAQSAWHPVAETAGKVRQCLETLHYQELIPR